MANEHLKRTPTSTGNRKKWTWAGWVKLNKDFGSSDYNTVWSVAAGTSGNNSDRFHLYHYSDGRWVTTGTSSFSSVFTGPGGSAAHSRDPGAWLHICLSVDTTGSNLVKDKYQRFWVNGIEYNYDDAGNIADNADLAINGLYEHYIGTRNSSAQRSYDGQMFDLYLVDGQALTPDVFGFYKDGDGYMSSGTTNATDFRPGQWSPHSPTKIKKDINRRGGFGVNGFYLPMNDSSNPGADFHCDPNSIIALKGEDLPQPRNGAPTTSDAYVSELRQETGSLGFDGAVSFDGNGDTLEFANSTDFEIGSSDFCMEAFIFAKELKDCGIFGNNQSSGSPAPYAGYEFDLRSDGALDFYSGNGSAYNPSNLGAQGPAGVIKIGRWYHIAAVRNGNNFRIYVDGNKVAENTSFSHTVANTNTVFRLGSDGVSTGTSWNFNGLISNARLVKGSPVYTANFTAPTEPLANVTNTKLLCCNSSTSATAATVSPGSITANGNAFATRNELTGSILLACPFVSGGLGQNGAANSTIPGLGDYHIALGGPSSVSAVNFLIASGNQAQITGDNGLYYGSSLDVTTSSINPRATVGTAFTPDGDYTVEFWVYINSFSAQGSHIVQYDTNAGQTGWLISADSGNLRWMLRNSSNQDVQVLASNVVKAQQWTHIAGVYDSNKNTMTAYLNGVAVGTTAVASNYLSTQYTNLNRIHIGSNVGNGSRPMQGYMQDLRVYKGIAKYKGGFDVPKPYTPVGIEAFRTTADTCKNNFCTWNSNTNDHNTPITLTNGNLTITQAGTWRSILGTHGVSSGKWYYEMKTVNDAYYLYLGWADGSHKMDTYPSTNNSGASMRIDEGKAYHDQTGDNTIVNLGATMDHNDIVGVAFDADNGRIWWSKNGSWLQGNPATGASPVFDSQIPAGETYFPIAGTYNESAHTNFGQNPSFCGTVTAGTNADGNGKGLFKYAPPSGYLALCEDNLPTPAIADPGKHFKSVLYTGDGIAARPITGVGFQPDFVWLKGRTSSSLNHILCDSIRGPKNTLFTNNQLAQYTDRGLNSFDQDGFTLFSAGGDENNNSLAGAPHQYVAWCWKAGGAAVSNNDGSITTQVSANQTSGFSIVLGTQTSGTTTFGHGLGKAPKMIITKQTNGTTGWYTYVKDIGYDRTLRLDQDSASASFAHWVAHPTTSVFSMGSGFGSGEAYVAYCFAEIEGFSKIGVYVGNGSADGPFVYCGFKPAWVLLKNADQNGTYWTIFDSSRKPTNPVNHTLNPNLGNLEETNGGNGMIDLVSNGFKCRNTDGGINANLVNYVFLAFAESPFQTSNAK